MAKSKKKNAVLAAHSAADVIGILAGQREKVRTE